MFCTARQQRQSAVRTICVGFATFTGLLMPSLLHLKQVTCLCCCLIKDQTEDAFTFTFPVLFNLNLCACNGTLRFIISTIYFASPVLPWHWILHCNEGKGGRNESQYDVLDRVDLWICFISVCLNAGKQTGTQVRLQSKCTDSKHTVRKQLI